ncbi:PREDICTED: cytochrome P450 6A1-like [Eufriesea mexicana]|uniref:cytochrome P450 6A1-like n=1 Tax=Eufriesea mexicana TaxID=516756 RepID=UPI00083C5DC6|nr:PREDICTED: cytochrome P450 6A1-like [Eufriesea mexicana]
MVSYFDILCGIVALVLLIYYYATSTFDFWKSRGVLGPRPLPFFGNTKDIMFPKMSTGEFVMDIYNKYKGEPLVGLYMRRSPFLIVNDSELMKDVLIRDFSHFSDRGNVVPEKAEPLSPNLFNLEPERWRPLRSKLSPIFTSGKLKEMYHLIIECTQHLEEYLNQEIEKGEPIDCVELTAKFTTDVIGTCAFGIETSALAHEDSEFRRMGKDVFAASLQNSIRMRMRQFLPKFYDLLGYVIPKQRYTWFFQRVIMETIKYREENDVYRPDFINMLMELQKHPDKMENIELTDSLLTAQAFVFFIAGFETSSTTMSNALYELALNQDIQDKLREEIHEYCGESNEKLNYDDVKGMKYLDKVFKETLRMYPPGARLTRRSVSDYTFNDTKVTIPKGTMIWIPILGIHRDPDIYPNPEIFDPERFDDDVVATRHSMHYMPFGDGPRNCIGARFAVNQTKLGLITILRNCKVEPCEKTMIPYVFNPRAFLLAPKEGIYLKITKL